MPKVFISYSHDSEKHRETVLALSERLREDEIKLLNDAWNGSFVVPPFRLRGRRSGSGIAQPRPAKART